MKLMGHLGQVFRTGWSQQKLATLPCQVIFINISNKHALKKLHFKWMLMTMSKLFFFSLKIANKKVKSKIGLSFMKKMTQVAT